MHAWDEDNKIKIKPVSFLGKKKKLETFESIEYYNRLNWNTGFSEI
jgi:hypothetical protein